MLPILRPIGSPVGENVHFTFFWPESDRWEGVDFRLRVEPPYPSQRRPLKERMIMNGADPQPGNRRHNCSSPTVRRGGSS